MQTTTVKLVTIIAENVLEERLVREIKKAGARGHTISKVRGEGQHGIRASDFAEGRNVKIEVLVRPEVADAILTHLSEHYFPNYAIVVYAQDVEVIRGDKYG